MTNNSFNNDIFSLKRQQIDNQKKPTSDQGKVTTISTVRFSYSFSRQISNKL